MTATAPAASKSAPPERQATRHVYYGLTKSLCGVCKRAVDAKIQVHDDAVWFDKLCPEHGKQHVLVASSAEWYLDALGFVAPHRPPARVARDVSEGCPFDCGPCAQHQQRVYLPVVPITSACNLDCPICYTVNWNEHAHQLSREGMAAILEHLARDHEELDIINFTGGEPTLHPGLLEFLAMCREKGVRRLTISTNGFRLLDEEYVRRLAALDARIVLSLDTFDPAVDRVLLGADTTRVKLQALALLEKHGVATTILPAVAAGLNDKDVGPLWKLVAEKPFIRSLELHTLCFTGQGGVGFGRAARITIPDLRRRLEEATAGAIRWTDFVPSPLAKGVNDHSIGESVKLLFERDFILSLMFQPAAYTGYGGAHFGPHDPLDVITIPDVVRACEEQTGGLLRRSDFFPLPCSHPSCFGLTYLLKGEGGFIPFPRFIDVERYLEIIANRGTIRPDESFETAMRDTINELWSSGGQLPDRERVLRSLERALRLMYPEDHGLAFEERLHLGEGLVKTVFIHAFMDEHTFEVDRIKKCCTHYALPDGRLMPGCAYNMFYRHKDPRYAAPVRKADIWGRTGAAAAKEVARYGIRVLCLAPGLLEDGVGRNLPEHRVKDYLKHCALGRIGTFAEVAALAAFLASDENGYARGDTFVCDGGV